MIKERAADGGEERFEGIAVSPGIAIGPVEFVQHAFERPASWPILSSTVDGEIRRLDEAIQATREQITQLQAKLQARSNGSEAHIFDAHLLVLEDQTVLVQIRQAIRENLQNADIVYYQVFSRYIESLRMIGDPYLRERAIDVEDVARRVLANLSHTEEINEDTPKASILFARDLTPSDTVDLDRRNILGFVTEQGSYTSHTAIMARSLCLPGVVGLDLPQEKLCRGEMVILDGHEGLLILRPTPETLAEYRQLIQQEGAFNESLLGLKDKKAVTSDGKSLILSANIEFGHEVELVKASGAAGVGLYRTEFFFFQEHHRPDEDRQAEVYSKAARSVHPDGVIIRTLDVGGDKFHHDEPVHRESNPFLGLRGIRLSLEERATFKTQLRAILRASAEGKVRVMYPMISGLEELRAANAILEECKTELRAEGRAFDEKLEVGCMIELPSAVLVAHELASEVSFFSVGTNDLIQYTIAVDRGNERVAHLYQPGHPAILRLLKMVVEAAHAHGIWAGVCGEMAGDVLFVAVLVGLGYDELSVGAGQVPRVKHVLSCLDSQECVRLVEQLLKLSHSEEVTRRLRELAAERFPDFLD